MKLLKEKYAVGDIVKLSPRLDGSSRWRLEFVSPTPRPAWGIVTSIGSDNTYSVMGIPGREVPFYGAWWPHCCITHYAGTLQDLLKGKLK